MMTFWQLLLFAVLQGPTVVSSDAVAARDAEFPGVLVERMPLAALRQRVADKDYVPVPRSQLQDLLQNDRSSAPVTEAMPRIREARYVARLNGTHLDQGHLEFDIYPESRSSETGPLQIGQTNLQQLQIADQQGFIELASDSARRLFLLKPGFPGNLTGSWTSDGLVTGDVVTFRLELPAATISRFELLADPNILLTSVGSLVLDPKPVPATSDDGELKKWTILPGDAARLTFSCRQQRQLQSLDPMPLASFNAAHELAGEILKSRWTIGLPAELNGRARLTARISGEVRVADVTLEDNRPVEWQVTEENHQQILSMLLPEASESTILNISAASVLPQTESWELPMLSLAQWFSRNDEQRGPIQSPIGQISVLMPKTVHLDEWTLVGIQERDIVTGPDQSREYQLTQFLPEASAIARTSTSEPRLTDSVVTLVEPAGRLATVRCLVNVQCEGASVVELQWPVSQDWQVIAARYASNSRALFFEFPQRDPEAATSPLTLHLPESLEPGASRVIEIQFRQSDDSDTGTINLPLAENRRIERINAVVLFPPAFTLNTDLQRHWTAGRPLLTLEEVRRSMTWLPESRLSNGGQFYAVSASQSTNLVAAVAADTPHSSGIELEHAVRIVEGKIVETSRIVLPADQQFGEFLTLLTPSRAADELRWSIDGEPIPVRRDDAAGEPQEWRRWSLKLTGRQSGIATVIRCESRQTAGHDIVATIPMPATDLPIHGTLQLFSSDEGHLTSPGLKPAGSRNSANSGTDDQSTAWELPAAPEAVRLVLGQKSRIQFGQTIDVHMLHMIDEHRGGLNLQVLAVANVSRRAGQNSLPLALPASVRPLVLVNGHRVQLQETDEGFAIPLPVSSVDCQVLLTWTEPAERPDTVTGNRILPRLFLREASVPQCTHHLLVSPQLELRATETEFAASDSTDVLHILDRLLTATESQSGNLRPIPDTNAPSEIRSFVSSWQLAKTRDWQQRTLIDTVQSEMPITIQVTQLRRRIAIAVGAALLLVALCIVLRATVLEYRLASAFTAFTLLGLSFLMTDSIAGAILTGTFWGLLIGLTIITVARWQWLHLFSRQTFVRSTSAAILLLIAIPPSSGQQPADAGASAIAVAVQQGTGILPDVLLPDTPLPDSDVAYVRRTILEKWQKKFAAEQSTLPAAVVTSLHTEIVAESAESVELLLRLEVAAVSGDELCYLRIPLQDSRLVQCTIDGNKVLPEPEGPDAILIPVPASSLLPTRTLANFVDDARSNPGHDSTQNGTPDEERANDTETSAAVDAGPLAAFTLHQIECRLRPVTTRQTSGLQFRLPALPCPIAEIKVSAPDGLFTGVRAQTPAGVLQWKPTDGAIRLNSLAMSEGIDIRLFQAGIEKGSPQLATVEILTIAEVISEQPVLSCFCRFSRWNPLAPEVRYYVPQGYQLVGVDSVNGGDLLWSTQDRIATILLPNAIGNEFVLSLQLKSPVSSPLQQRRIPIAELIQFADCVVSPNLLLAVRVNPVFSVLPIDDVRVTTLAFADAQAAWGQWLRRSDSVFTVPSGIPECVVRLAARNSLNEVRIDQSFTIRNQRIDWKCQVDIDTTVLPVFRHRLTISSEIQITDVQVTAGEANRLATWHRRGDRLVVQLKEGTTGLHILKISGRQLLRPDDTRIAIRSPHVHDAQIPKKSSLELTDQDGLGLAFEKLGTAVPNERLAVNDLLQPGIPVRMQILDESDPIVLQRMRPVEPFGSIAVIRSVDQAAFAIQLSQWSGSLGPLEMKFADATEFLTEPSVLVDGRQFPLIREGNEYIAGQEVIRELFDQPDFAIVWSMPIPESQRRAASITFPWPEISDRIQWTERWLIPLDTTPGTISTAAANTAIPAWLKDSSAMGFGKDLAALKVRIFEEVVELSGSGTQLIIPLNTVTEVPDTEPVRALFAVADSMLWSNPNQSAVGQTTLVIFATRTPGRCSLIIPNGTVVTELETAEAIRWEDVAREKVTVDLTKLVTVIQIRWMSVRAKNGFASTTLQFAAPFPADCETRRSVTVVSSEGERPQFLGDVRNVPVGELDSVLRAELAAGLTRSQPHDATAVGATEPLATSDEMAKQLSASRAEFIQGFTGKSNQPTLAMASCLPHDSSKIEVFSRKRLQWPTVISIAAGFLAIAGAAFGQSMRSDVNVSITRIATQSSDFQRSESQSQTSAGSRPPASESASADPAHRSQN